MDSAQGMKVKDVEKLTQAFLDNYNGNIDVLPIVKEKQEDIYGEQNSIENYGAIIQGAFHPASRVVTLVASNMDNEEEVKTTLRHELLGHYGLNTLKPEDKLGLLLHVRATENEPSLKDVWDKVNALYPDKTGIEKAEEVFAFVAEKETHFLSDAWDRVCSAFNEVLRKTGLIDKPLTKSDLRTEALSIAKGIQSGERALQTFPASDTEQFRKEESMNNDKKPYHVTVAEKIIKQLEEGTAPWQKPWKAGENNAFLPFNPTTGNRYKGINALHLMSEGREDQRWLTYKQAQSMGAQVKSGEKSTRIQYWKFSEEQVKRDEKTGKVIKGKDGKPLKEIVRLERPRVFYASVFNAEQIDNMPKLEPQEKPEQQWTPIERAEKILAASGAKIAHSQNDRAFYNSSKDEIHMPRKEQFDSADKYYATALHELGHWTGHNSRLDRPLGNPFGSEAYAKEELRAEISSMLVGEELQIGHDPEQHIAYVDSWIKALKNDPMEIFRAAADAEKITNFVMAFELKQELEQNNQNTSSLTLSDLTNHESKLVASSAKNIEEIANVTGMDIRLSGTMEKGTLTGSKLSFSNGQDVYPIETHLRFSDGKVQTTLDGIPAKDIPYTNDEGLQQDALLFSLKACESQLLTEKAQMLGDDFVESVLERTRQGDNFNASMFTYMVMEETSSDLELAEAFQRKNGNIEQAETFIKTIDQFSKAMNAIKNDVDNKALSENEQLKELILNDHHVSRSRGEDFDTALTSYLNLIETADSLGFSATLKQSEKEQSFPTIEVHYNKGEFISGVVSEISLGDGKVATSVDGKRVSGTNFTNEKEWQQDALYAGLSQSEQMKLYEEALEFSENPAIPMSIPSNTTQSTTNLDSVYFTMTNLEHAQNMCNPMEGPKQGIAYYEMERNIQIIGEEITQRQNTLRGSGIMTDDQIHETLSESQIEAWEQIKETALLKAAIPTLSINNEQAGMVTFAPSDIFSEVSASIDLSNPESEFTVLTKTGPVDSLEDALNQALLQVRLEHLSQDEKTDLSQREPSTNTTDFTVSSIQADGNELSFEVENQDRVSITILDPTGEHGAQNALGLLQDRVYLPLSEVTYNSDYKASATLTEPTTQKDIVDSLRVLQSVTNGQFEVKSVEKHFEKENVNVGIASQSDTSRLANERYYIDVPYKDKDDAKELGAKWDKAEKSWYVPKNFPIEQFEQWDKNKGSLSTKVPNQTTSKANQENDNRNSRTYLAVPYANRAEAKAAGAKWDKSAKSWFADEKSDMEKLTKFLNTQTTVQDPALSPSEEFTKFLEDNGAIVDGDHPIMDGTKQRIQTKEDKSSQLSGFYVAYDDGLPNGVYVDNRSGVENKWVSKGYSLSDEEKAKVKAESAQKLEQRKKDKAARYERVANELSEFFDKSPATVSHDYLAVKNIDGKETRIATKATLKGLKEDSNIKVAQSINEAKSLREESKDNIVFMEGDLLIPARDSDNKIWSVQAIQKNGFKSFASGGKKTGNYCIVGGQTALKDAKAIVVSEGYATSKSVEKVAKTEGAATVAAFDSNNLLGVVKSLRELHPDKPIIIAGDDDKALELKPPRYENAGKEKAIAAANAVNGTYVLPVFGVGEAESGLSDFNDLENKSKLGKAALERQLRTAVKKAVARSLSEENSQSIQREKTKEVEKRVQRQEKQQTFMSPPPKRRSASR